MGYHIPSDYERKFADFVKLCGEAKGSGVGDVIIASPKVIGDNYEEIVESLSRLAEAGLALRIAGR